MRFFYYNEFLPSAAAIGTDGYCGHFMRQPVLPSVGPLTTLLLKLFEDYKYRLKFGWVIHNTMKQIASNSPGALAKKITPTWNNVES